MFTAPKHPGRKTAASGWHECRRLSTYPSPLDTFPPPSRRKYPYPPPPQTQIKALNGPPTDSHVSKHHHHHRHAHKSSNSMMPARGMSISRNEPPVSRYPQPGFGRQQPVSAKLDPVVSSAQVWEIQQSPLKPNVATVPSSIIRPDPRDNPYKYYHPQAAAAAFVAATQLRPTPVRLAPTKIQHLEEQRKAMQSRQWIDRLPPQTLQLIQQSPDKRLLDLLKRADPNDVFLKVYDITSGKAKKVISHFLGLQVDGIWHTSLFCFGKEHFYCDGVKSMASSIVETKFAMTLERVLYIGRTPVGTKRFAAILQELRVPYSSDRYDLVQRNCNHFTDALLKRIWGPTMKIRALPKYISEQPNLFMSSVRGRTLVWLTKGALERVDNFLSRNFAVGLDDLIGRWI